MGEEFLPSIYLDTYLEISLRSSYNDGFLENALAFGELEELLRGKYEK